MNGKVYLIGAGPGDEGLISVKGRNCIRTADVIIYDYLASPALLKQAAGTGELIYVGKKGGDHTLSQDGINKLIVAKAKSGLMVARLKGGDPFIFGRGGEEAEVLIDEGIPFEIVPGVTSAIAAPAYAGIPLTHRDYTATVAFVTGHEDPNKDESRINWEALAKGIGTIVFLMGVKNLSNITGRLLHHGMSPETPVALVRWGTTSRQVTVSGTLATIVEAVKKAGLKAPAVTVVGDVVSLRRKMAWFEKRPLFGKRIVVTRARAQASGLVSRLTALGADCLEVPTIKIVPTVDFNRLDSAINQITDYQWLLFTSVNGVKIFFKRLHDLGQDARQLGHMRTAVIGPATADALLGYGFKSDIVPQSYRAESVVTAFADVDLTGQKILLPRAAGARPILPVELTQMGAMVDEVIIYEAKADNSRARELAAELKERRIHLITFTSSSTVTNFKDILLSENTEDALLQLMSGVKIGCIGPITADTARSLGFQVTFTAEEYTIPGLCKAISAHYENAAG